jgi:hypothetical protein
VADSIIDIHDDVHLLGHRPTMPHTTEAEESILSMSLPPPISLEELLQGTTTSITTDYILNNNAINIDNRRMSFFYPRSVQRFIMLPMMPSTTIFSPM